MSASEGYLGFYAFPASFGLSSPAFHADIFLHAILATLTLPFYLLTMITSVHWIDMRDMIDVVGTSFS